MIKTADLQRSKRLKGLGFEQEGNYWWWENTDRAGEACLCVDERKLVGAQKPELLTSYEKIPCCVTAPQAGEMIEWLLEEGCFISINRTGVAISKKEDALIVETKDGNICNALADACAWVLERKE